MTTKPENPCVPECPLRTVTCKFDGSCGGYAAYREQMDKYGDEMRACAEAARAANELRSSRIAYRAKRVHKGG